MQHIDNVAGAWPGVFGLRTPRLAQAAISFSPPAQPDELQLLLVALRFAHWRGCVVTLLERYDGWAADRSPGAALSPDYEPLSDVLAVLDTFPARLAGNNAALARALLACPFLVRAAQDARTEEPWEPLQQRYRDFAAARPVRQCLLPDIPWPEQDFVDWALEQLSAGQPSPTTPTGR